MSFCSNCGAEIREGFTVCTACGAPVETPAQPDYRAYAAPQQPAQPQYQPYQQVQQPVNPAANAPYMQNPETAPQQGYQPYNAQQPTYQQPPYTQYNQGFNGAQSGLQEQYAAADKARKLGIAAIILGFFFPLIAWICGGIGMSRAKAALQMAESLGDQALLQKAKSSKTLCLVGVIIGIVSCVISAVMMSNS